MTLEETFNVNVWYPGEGGKPGIWADGIYKAFYILMSPTE